MAMCRSIVLLLIASSTSAWAADPPRKGKSPAEDLPPYITQLTHFGERADWSHDGRQILFLSKTFGDAFEIDIRTKQLHLLTGHYHHHGYTRALYLANGDILLSGPERFDRRDPGTARVQCALFVLGRSLNKPPVPLGTKCSEGPAVSRKRMHLAWTQVAPQFPDKLPKGVSQMLEADIVYEKGQPRLANQRLIIDSRDLPFPCTLETQNFRPPQETELIFSAYGYQGTEVCGIDLASKKVTNYSQAPDQYDEPEGIFPDGRFTCVECDRENGAGKKGSQHIDIWKLALDGSGRWERLTTFNRYPGYKASNPVICDDGRYMAFQMARVEDPAGVGRGIFVYDLRHSPRQETPK
jgi:hypothetical protein